ncbi:MAG TPA: hypothetical protein DD414_02750 [Lachnospiraceae bacterium]|nr:hypothetical protein [Lachnospiraceae bacterium]
MKKIKYCRVLAWVLVCMMLLETPVASFAEEAIVEEETSEAEQNQEAIPSEQSEDTGSDQVQDDKDAELPESGQNEAGEKSGQPGDAQNEEDAEGNQNGTDTESDQSETGQNGDDAKSDQPEDNQNGDNITPEQPGESGNPDPSVAEHPEKVLTLNCMDRTRDCIELSFPLEDGISKYELYRQEGDQAEVLLETWTDPQTENNREYVYTDETAVNLSDYIYCLYGYVHTGEEYLFAGKSELITVEYNPERFPALSAPVTPQDFMVSARDYCSLELTWKKVEGVSGYELCRSEKEDGEYEPVAEVSGADISYTDEGLTFGSEYWYKIRSFTEQEGKGRIYSEYSASDEGLAGPGMVKGLTAEPAAYNTIQLNWDPIPGVKGYEICLNGEEKPFKVLSRNTYKYTKAVCGELYSFRVRAYQKVGRETRYGGLSEAVSVTTALAKPEPYVSKASYNCITVKWPKVAGATRYEILVSDSADGPFEERASVRRNSYSQKEVIFGKTYYYKVKAYRRHKNYVEECVSEASDAVSAIACLAKPEPYVYKIIYNGITLKWPKVANAAGYKIEVSDSESGDFQELATVKGSSYSHKKLETGKTYYYKVTAYREEYRSESDVISGTPEYETIAGLKATGISTSEIKISWKRVAGVEKYQIKRYSSLNNAKDDSNVKHTGNTTKISYTDSGLEEDTLYYYTVCGIRKDGKATKVVGPVSARTKKSSDSPGDSGGSGGAAYGIDVAQYQGTIDWKAVKNDGIDFAMLRILVRNGSKDSQFERNYEKAREAGVKVGVYRYSYAQSVSGAEDEAREVVNALNGRKLDYPIALDMEDSSQHHISSSTKADMILAYKKVVESAGYKFILYANTDWLNNRIDMSRLSNIDIWIARWRNLSLGHGYTGPGRVNMWQYSDSGRIAGISDKVDLDYCYKSY